MIKVYFESSAHAEHVASFASEDLYMDCLPALEARAESMRMFVTDTVEDKTPLQQIAIMLGEEKTKAIITKCFDEAFQIVSEKRKGTQ